MAIISKPVNHAKSIISMHTRSISERLLGGLNSAGEISIAYSSQLSPIHHAVKISLPE